MRGTCGFNCFKPGILLDVIEDDSDNPYMYYIYQGQYQGSYVYKHDCKVLF